MCFSGPSVVNIPLILGFSDHPISRSPDHPILHP
jgi:hypothetical protein